MRFAPLLCLALLCGCDPTAFSDLEDEAGVRVLERPDSYRRRDAFGTRLAAFTGVQGAEDVSRLVVSAGEDSGTLVYEGWTGTGIGLGSHLFEMCEDATDCDPGTGAAVLGVDVWSRGTSREGSLCAITTAPPMGSIRVECESSGGVIDRFVGPPGVDFGVAAASLGGAVDVGVGILGAPGGSGGAGEVWRMVDGAAPVPINLPAGTVSASGRLGEAVAAVALGRTQALVAAAAPGDQRVVVFQLEVDGTASVRGCLDGAADGYGMALAVGDLDGDDLPELVVGARPDATGAPFAVEVHPGTGIPALGECVPWGGATEVLVCPDALRGVDCAGSAFGGSLAIGDVNADGIGDLIVGASRATVEGENGAGAVYVFAGPDFGERDVLTHSSPEAEDHLGGTVAALPTVLSGTPRHEPVASSTGREAAVVFLCSGLSGDTPEVGTRCLPQ